MQFEHAKRFRPAPSGRQQKLFRRNPLLVDTQICALSACASDAARRTNSVVGTPNEPSSARDSNYPSPTEPGPQRGCRSTNMTPMSPTPQQQRRRLASDGLARLDYRKRGRRFAWMLPNRVIVGAGRTPTHELHNPESTSESLVDLVENRIPHAINRKG